MFEEANNPYSLFSRLGNAEDANHAAYLDFSVSTGSTNLPFQASIIAKTAPPWAVYTQTNAHSGTSTTHADNRYVIYNASPFGTMQVFAAELPPDFLAGLD